MITKHTLLKTFTALFILFSFKLTLAAIPSTLNYQGHLTDSSGVPIDGSVNMVFTIYDIDTGGSALWSDASLVTVQQGVFSVELGGTSNPFPVGLFESPLWVGLTVGTDAEMTPRRPISSVGFSFKARDADTIDGVSANTLNQSAHVSDTANPHNVTASQIGASTGPHTIDTNAVNLCSDGQYLRGDGVCVAGFLDADGVDAYNASYDSEAEIDAAVDNNGYSIGAHTTDTHAGTICPAGTYLNGDGTCDIIIIPQPYPEVNYSRRKNTSLSPTFFSVPSHHLTVSYTSSANDFTIVSDNTNGKYVVIDDGTDTTTSGSISGIGTSITKNVPNSRVTTIDVIEGLNNDKLHRYRCMINGSANLVACTQEIY